MSSIIAVGLVGKTNQPLLLKNFSTEPSHLIDFSIFSSLDSIDEKLQAHKNNNEAVMDPYLGFLCQSPWCEKDYLVYGYVTATNVKILLLINDLGKPINDQSVLVILRAIHRLYADEVCSPFFAGCIDTPRFTKRLGALLSAPHKLIVG